MPQTPDRAVSKRIIWKTERRRLGVCRKANSPVFLNTHYSSSDITNHVLVVFWTCFDAYKP